MAIYIHVCGSNFFHQRQRLRWLMHNGSRVEKSALLSIDDCAILPVYHDFMMDGFSFSFPSTKCCCTDPFLFPAQPKIQS